MERTVNGSSSRAAGRWKAVAILAITVILSLTTWFSASAVIPQLRAEWSLNQGAAAWLTITVQLGFVAGALASSLFNLPDVYSPRSMLIAGCVGAAAANALLLLAGDGAQGMGPRFATGFFLAGVYPTAVKLMSTWFREGRGTAIGIMVGALTIGSAGPHLVNGLGGLDWRMVVSVTSLLTLAAALIAYVFVREGPFALARVRFDAARIGRVLADRGVRLASLGYFGHMWELFAMWAWFVVFFAAHLQGRSSPLTAAPFATFAVIGIGGIGCWVAGIMGDRWGRTNTTMLMMGISGMCAATIGLLIDGPTWLLLGVGAVWGFTVVADSAQFSTMVTELAAEDYVGTALTLQLALGFTLTVVTIWLIPVLEDWFTWRWAFAFLTPGPVLGIIAMLRLRSLPEARRIAGGRG